MIILKIKVKKEFMEMLLTMAKLLVVAIAILEKINKIRDMMEVQMENSLSIEVKI
jgi:hypothetical protein